MGEILTVLHRGCGKRKLVIQEGDIPDTDELTSLAGAWSTAASPVQPPVLRRKAGWQKFWWFPFSWWPAGGDYRKEAGEEWRGPPEERLGDKFSFVPLVEASCCWAVWVHWQVQSTMLVWIWKNPEISQSSPYRGLLTGFLEFHPFESFSCNASVVTTDIPFL